MALGGFALDSLIEIGASTVVVWQLTGTEAGRERVAMRLIGGAFIALAIYIAVQGIYLLATGRPPVEFPVGRGLDRRDVSGNAGLGVRKGAHGLGPG